jgi:hypothetical protein
MKLAITGLIGLAFVSQTAGAEPPEAPPQALFKCDKGRELAVQFVMRDAVFVAVVNAGSGDHTLPVRPPEGNDPQVVWSDGVRTLVWTAGVHLMWMDGASEHLMCGRGEHHH